MPPTLRLAPVNDRKHFAMEVDALRRTLEEDRKKPPSGPLFGPFFGSDGD
jgi:hypothetical protein